MAKINNNLNKIDECIENIIILQNRHKKAIANLDGDEISSISNETSTEMESLANLESEAISIIGDTDVEYEYPELSGIRNKIMKSIDHVQRNNIELQVRLMASSNTISSILLASGVIDKKTTYSRDLT